jgi:tetratricopeptide (TPR) repeat protein
LVQHGYQLLASKGPQEAVKKWLEAWELIKEMATPEMRTTEAFAKAHPHLTEIVFNWASDLEMELGNAGIDDPVYHEHRVRFVDEFLAQFPDEEDSWHVQLLRAKGEALFRLGRPEEGAAAYQALIDRCPDEAWAYIGWSDQYHFGWGVPVDFERAEALLLQALQRRSLKDRADALERLADLYYRWGRMEDYERTVKKLPARRRPHRPPWMLEAKSPPAEKPGRNDPCWCGSGKKYKHCHLRSDQRQ